MEIIKEGKLPEDKEAEGTCNRCDTVIFVTRGEGEVVHDQRDGDYVVYRCPVCDNDITISLRTFV